MTPDFLAGLFIGSMLVYACWLLSLRLEPEPPADWHPDPEDPIGDALVLLDKAFSDDA